MTIAIKAFNLYTLKDGTSISLGLSENNPEIPAHIPVAKGKDPKKSYAFHYHDDKLKITMHQLGYCTGNPKKDVDNLQTTAVAFLKKITEKRAKYFKPELKQNAKITLDKDIEVQGYWSGDTLTLKKGDEITYTGENTISGKLIFTDSSEAKIKLPQKVVRHLFKIEKPKKPLEQVKADWLPNNEKDWKEWGDQYDYSSLAYKHRYAIGQYTGSHHRTLNKGLRNEAEGLSDHFITLMNNLDSVFETKAAIVPEAIKVRRTFGESHPLTEMLNSETLKPGDTYTDKGF